MTDAGLEAREVDVGVATAHWPGVPSRLSGHLHFPCQLLLRWMVCGSVGWMGLTLGLFLHDAAPIGWFWLVLLGTQTLGLMLLVTSVGLSEPGRVHAGCAAIGAACMLGGSCAGLPLLGTIRRQAAISPHDVPDRLARAAVTLTAATTAMVLAAPVLWWAAVAFRAAVHHALRWRDRRWRKPRHTLRCNLAAFEPGLCPVCLMLLSDGGLDSESCTSGDGLVRLCCGHAFHADCIDRWLDRRYTCPVCRAEVDDLRECCRLLDIESVASDLQAASEPLDSMSCGPAQPMLSGEADA